MPAQTAIPHLRTRLLGSALALILGACATVPDAPPVFVPQVQSAFTQKVPGRWVLAVSNTSLDTQIAPKNFACGDMTFPVGLDAPLPRYVVQSFRQIADDITLSDHVLTDDEIRAGGYAGQIVLGSAALTPDVAFAQHGLTAYVDSNMALSAALDVRGHSALLLHRAFTVNGISHTDAGIICQNGPGGIGRAADSAMQQLAVAAATAFSDSTSIRLTVASR
jgi:hypothetical protein